MKNKKAQFEIFGVVLIVIILVLAMFFMIGNSLKKKKDITQSFTDAELGQNMLTSLMRMKIEDCGTTFSEIVKYCVSDIHDKCGGSINTCQYIKELLKNGDPNMPGIFDETLEEWGKKYRFSILIKDSLDEKEYDILTDPDDKWDKVDGTEITSEKPCTIYSEKEAPGVIPLPRPRGSGSDPTNRFSGPIIVKLEICK
ncbi:hypothetical protein HOD20_01470 [archaeon]|jgi:hypothetical protein|nr:hypothetical protein [archaeon]MBT6820791.1 hypothetical protein [archaeon]MBT7392124.1 hypothetical protein [archaeon]